MHACVRICCFRVGSGDCGYFLLRPNWSTNQTSHLQGDQQQSKQPPAPASPAAVALERPVCALQVRRGDKHVEAPPAPLEQYMSLLVNATAEAGYVWMDGWRGSVERRLASPHRLQHKRQPD